MLQARCHLYKTGTYNVHLGERHRAPQSENEERKVISSMYAADEVSSTLKVDIL